MACVTTGGQSLQRDSCLRLLLELTHARQPELALQGELALELILVFVRLPLELGSRVTRLPLKVELVLLVVLVIVLILACLLTLQLGGQWGEVGCTSNLGRQMRSMGGQWGVNGSMGGQWGVNGGGSTAEMGCNEWVGGGTCLVKSKRIHRGGTNGGQWGCALRGKSGVKMG